MLAVVALAMMAAADPAEAAKHRGGSNHKASTATTITNTTESAAATGPVMTISRNMASDLPPVAAHLRPSTASPLGGEFAVSSGYGWRRNPFGGGLEIHPGIDLVAAAGTPIRSVVAGTVAAVGPNGGYGLAVDVIGHDGTLVRYGHMHKAMVKIGQRVAAGGVIGQVGSTGRSTGPHLHFEVRRDDKPISPVPLLRQALAGGGEVERRVLAGLDSAAGGGKGRDRAERAERGERVLVASAGKHGHNRVSGSGSRGSSRGIKGNRQLAAVCAAGGGGYLCGSTLQLARAGGVGGGP